jgi:hypothetical protein
MQHLLKQQEQDTLVPAKPAASLPEIAPIKRDILGPDRLGGKKTLQQWERLLFKQGLNRPWRRKKPVAS